MTCQEWLLISSFEGLWRTLIEICTDYPLAVFHISGDRSLHIISLLTYYISGVRSLYGFTRPHSISLVSEVHMDSLWPHSITLMTWICIENLQSLFQYWFISAEHILHKIITLLTAMKLTFLDLLILFYPFCFCWSYSAKVAVLNHINFTNTVVILHFTRRLFKIHLIIVYFLKYQNHKIFIHKSIILWKSKM